MNIVIPALAFFLVTALVSTGSNVQGPEEAQVTVNVSTLKLEKPQFEWVRCTCPNGSELGLTNGDFIKFQMWAAGVEDQARKTCGSDLYWPPSTKFVQR